jgi:Uma2 family endonuclease
LAARINRDRYHVFVADFAVSTHTGIRYPDITVVSVDRTTRRFTEAPTLLIEILSPTSTAADMREKVDEYLRLPSLEAYVVLAQDDAVGHLWLRGPDGFPTRLEIVTPAISPAVEIPTLELSLALAEIYRGVL